MKEALKIKKSHLSMKRSPFCTLQLLIIRHHLLERFNKVNSFYCSLVKNTFTCILNNCRILSIIIHSIIATSFLRNIFNGKLIENILLTNPKNEKKS